MLDRSLSHMFVKMAKTPQTVDVVLKEVRIHSPDMYTELLCICFHRIPIIFLVPGYMYSDTRADTSDFMYLGCVCQLFEQIARCSRPVKDLEARPRIAISPGGSLDIELLNC